MICIKCGHRKTKITNSRYVSRQHHTWRRHQCIACGFLFSTYEHIAYDQLQVSEGDTLVPFSRPRLLFSIADCLEHIKDKKPDHAEALTGSVVQKITLNLSTEYITPRYIAETTYLTLKHYDKLASVQYAARHSSYLKKYLK